jgi:CheY-like chemotaxis protein
LQGQDAWDLLTKLKREERTASIPLVIASTTDDRRKGLALGASAYGVKHIDKQWLLKTLDALVPHRRAVRVLSVDDEETSRFIVREMLNDPTYEVFEASSGREGLRLAHELVPDVILLDFRLTDMTGADAHDHLRQDPAVAAVPVILVTSQTLSTEDRERLGSVGPVLPKSTLTRDGLRTAVHEAIAAGQPDRGEVRA